MEFQSFQKIWWNPCNLYITHPSWEVTHQFLVHILQQRPSALQESFLLELKITLVALHTTENVPAWTLVGHVDATCAWSSFSWSRRDLKQFMFTLAHVNTPSIISYFLSIMRYKFFMFTLALVTTPTIIPFFYQTRYKSLPMSLFTEWALYIKGFIKPCPKLNGVWLTCFVPPNCWLA